MAVLPILTGEDNPVLRAKTKNIAKVTKELETLLKDMLETTIAAKGAGIAAPQVGRTERLCIALIHKELVPLVNPKITWKSDEIVLAEEGCLSLPNVWLQVPRSAEIVVKFKSIDGKDRELKLKDWDARVVQHEVDHLEGTLIVDYRAK